MIILLWIILGMITLGIYVGGIVYVGIIFDAVPALFALVLVLWPFMVLLAVYFKYHRRLVFEALETEREII